MDPRVALVGWAEFIVVFSLAFLLIRKNIGEKDLPRIAVLSAGIFVAQMLNFPVGGGTTGHLVGGALFAILVGPLVAMVGMTIILVIQALMFGDGGLTSLGLNAVNMAIIAPLAGWGVFTLVRPILRKGERDDALDPGTGLAVALGAWASVFLASAACAAELVVSYAISGADYGISATIAIPSMLGYHAVIGVGEAIITLSVVSYVWTTSLAAFSRKPRSETASDLLSRLAKSRTAQATLAMIVVFALALPLYFLYSAEGADGLEKTMEDGGVGEAEPAVASPFGYGEDYFAALFAGILGFVAVALVSLGLMGIMRTSR
jgi:cobalt/nickel transport system permease protein